MKKSPPKRTRKYFSQNAIVHPIDAGQFLALPSNQPVGFELPAVKFTWKSDPIDRCAPAVFAVIGDEVNARYYDETGTS